MEELMDKWREGDDLFEPWLEEEEEQKSTNLIFRKISIQKITYVYLN